MPGQPSEIRVALFYEKLANEKMARGRGDTGNRDFAQKIVYVEDACKSVLEAIAN
jgi:hypothetical protein